MIPCASAVERDDIVNIVKLAARENHNTATINQGVQMPWNESATGCVEVELIEEDNGMTYLTFEGDLYTCNGTSIFNDEHLLGCGEIFQGGREDREVIAVRGVKTSSADVVINALRARGLDVVSASLPALMRVPGLNE